MPKSKPTRRSGAPRGNKRTDEASAKHPKARRWRPPNVRRASREASAEIRAIEAARERSFIDSYGGDDEEARAVAAYVFDRVEDFEIGMRAFADLVLNGRDTLFSKLHDGWFPSADHEETRGERGMCQHESFLDKLMFELIAEAESSMSLLGHDDEADVLAAVGYWSRLSDANRAQLVRLARRALGLRAGRGKVKYHGRRAQLVLDLIECGRKYSELFPEDVRDAYYFQAWITLGDYTNTIVAEGGAVADSPDLGNALAAWVSPRRGEDPLETEKRKRDPERLAIVMLDACGVDGKSWVDAALDRRAHMHGARKRKIDSR